MSLGLTVRVFNTANNAPISGASIFVDGVNHTSTDNSPLVTGSAGSLFVSLENIGSRKIQAKATGFNTQLTTVVVVAANTFKSVNIGLVPTTPTTVHIKLQFNPPIPGIVWNILDDSSTQVDAGTSEVDGSAISNIALVKGNYTVTADRSGYEPASQAIVVSDSTSPYLIRLIKSANSNTEQSQTTLGPANYVNEADDITDITTQSPDGTEFIYPNTDYDKYFTITGARVYIGNLFIDEVYSLQYGLQDNAIPIYGYASRRPDAFAQGRSLVQGQLVLNFVTEGYMFTVLNEYNKYLQSSLVSLGFADIAAEEAVAKILGWYATKQALSQTLQGSNTDTEAMQTIASTLSNLDERITNKLATLTPEQIQLISRVRTAQATESLDVTGLNNAVYQDVIFDMRIEFGNETTGVKRTRLIEQCKLISNEQVLDPSGSVILDAYGFIARSMR